MEHWPACVGWQVGCLRWVKNGQECEKYWKSLGKSWEKRSQKFLFLPPFLLIKSSQREQNAADDQPQPVKIIWNEKKSFPNGYSCLKPLLFNTMLPQFIKCEGVYFPEFHGAELPLEKLISIQCASQQSKRSGVAFAWARRQKVHFPSRNGIWEWQFQEQLANNWGSVERRCQPGSTLCCLGSKSSGFLNNLSSEELFYADVESFWDTESTPAASGAGESWLWHQ